MLSGLQNIRGLANDFLEQIAGDRREGLVDGNDDALRIGNHDGLAGAIEHLGRQTQLLVGVPAARDVAGLGADRPHDAVLVKNREADGFKPDASRRQLQLIDRLDRRQRAHGVQILAAQEMGDFGRKQLLIRFADDGRRTNPEQLFKTLVGKLIPAGGVLQPDQRDGMIHDLQQAFLAGLDLGVGDHQIRIIDHHQHDALRRADRIQHRCDEHLIGLAIRLGRKALLAPAEQGLAQVFFDLAEVRRQLEAVDVLPRTRHRHIVAARCRAIGPPQEKIGIKHHHGEIHGVINALELAVDRRQLGRFDLAFLIDADQFLVGRLQLLIRGFQFLVGRLQLLVGRLNFLVQRLHLLARGGHLLHQRLQVLARRRQLAFRTLFGQLGLLGRLGLCRLFTRQRHAWLDSLRPNLAGRLEGHQEQLLVRLADQRMDRQPPDRAVERRHAALAAEGADLTPPGAIEGGQQLIGKFGNDQLRQIHLRRAGREGDQTAQIAMTVQDAEARIHQHRRAKAIGHGIEENPVVRAGDRARHMGQRLQLPALQLAHRGHADRHRPPLPAGPENTRPTVGCRKQGLLLAGRLGTPEKQQTVIAQGIAQDRQHLGLQLGVEVDHHIAAGHQIDAQKRRIHRNVLARKGDAIAQRFGGLKAVAARLKIAADVLLRHLRHRRLVVDAPPGHGQGVVINVRGKNLQANLVARLGDQLGKEDGQRIGLLAGGAADHPDPDLLAQLLARHQLATKTLQRPKGILVTEKLGHRNQRFLGQRIEFLRMRVGVGQIGRQRAGIGGHHTPLQTPLNGRQLVARKIDLGVLTHPVKKLGQFGRALLQPLEFRHRTGEAQQPFQLAPHLIGRENAVGKAGIDG